MKRNALLALSVLLMLSGGGAHADEGKDESGKGKPHRHESKDKHKDKDKDRRAWEHKKDRRGPDDDDYFHRHGHTRIPNGHLPPPGECRIWYPGRPAGHQPPPFKCGQARAAVEPGGWYMKPGPRPQEVEVVVYDAQRPGVVVDIGIFDARTGSMIRISGAAR